MLGLGLKSELRSSGYRRSFEMEKLLGFGKLMKYTFHQDLSFSPRTLLAEGENLFLQVFTYTLKKCKKNKTIKPTQTGPVIGVFTCSSSPWNVETGRSGAQSLHPRLHRKFEADEDSRGPCLKTTTKHKVDFWALKSTD